MKSLNIKSIALGAAVVGLLIGGYFLVRHNRQSLQGFLPDGGVLPGDGGSGSYASDIINYNNTRELVGFSSNVFVAKIIEIIGTEPRLGDPETQFNAEVIYNIKGNLEGRVTIRNYRNFHQIQPGVTYVFAARGDSARGYTLNTNSAVSKLISANSTLTNSQLAELAENDSRVQELLVGYVYEIIVQHQSKDNSFQSLSQEEKEMVLARIKNLPPAPPTQPENTRALCTDKIDNDEDHFLDLADADCKAFLPPPITENTKILCSDSIDNDRDGEDDLRDPDCGVFAGPENTQAFCFDGLDNDLDAYRDARDPDCGPFYAPAPLPPPPPPPPQPVHVTSTPPALVIVPTSTEQ